MTYLRLRLSEKVMRFYQNLLIFLHVKVLIYIKNSLPSPLRNFSICFTQCCLLLFCFFANLIVRFSSVLNYFPVLRSVKKYLLNRKRNCKRNKDDKDKDTATGQKIRDER
jgi:hypothetical protein